MSDDVATGQPLVAHIVVALCDNEHQGIVRVPEALGNGDDPAGNLYWGAMYGVKTYFARDKHWRKLTIEPANNKHILERVAFVRTIERNKGNVTAIVIAEAWRGRYIKAAIDRFLELSAGQHAETLSLTENSKRYRISAGGAAHLLGYVGHNGLMEFDPPLLTSPADKTRPNSAVVLACASDGYFGNLLDIRQTHKLISTSGLMAPEAYTLEATISSWFAGNQPSEVRKAAANAYAKYQKANPAWAKTLFVTDE